MEMLNFEPEIKRLLNSNPDTVKDLFSKIAQGYTLDNKGLTGSEYIYSLLTHCNPDAKCEVSNTLIGMIKAVSQDYYCPQLSMIGSKTPEQITLIHSNQSTPMNLGNNTHRLYINLDQQFRESFLNDIIYQVNNYDKNSGRKLNFALKMATDNERIDNIVFYCEKEEDLQALTQILTFLHDSPRASSVLTNEAKHNTPMNTITFGTDKKGKGWLGYARGGDSATTKASETIEQAFFKTIIDCTDQFQLTDKEMSKFTKALNKAHNQTQTKQQGKSKSIFEFVKTKFDSMSNSIDNNTARQYYESFFQNNLPQGITMEEIVTALLSICPVQNMEQIGESLHNNINTMLPNINVPKCVADLTNSNTYSM